MFSSVVAVDGRAGVLVVETAQVPAGLDDLPRLGTVWQTVPGLDRLDWFGSGPQESYPDRRAGGHVGRFGCGADDWYVPYLRPQENGGRHGVRWLQLTGAGPALTVVLDRPRQVSVTRYAADDLSIATHPGELSPQPGHLVHVDAAHRGVGTASCGPDTLPEYLLAPGEYRWSYLLL